MGYIGVKSPTDPNLWSQHFQNPGHPKYAILIKARDFSACIFSSTCWAQSSSHIMVHIEKKKRNSLTDGMVQRGEKTCIKLKDIRVQLQSGCLQNMCNFILTPSCPVVFLHLKRMATSSQRKPNHFPPATTLFRCYYHRWWLKNHPFVGHNTEVGIGKSFQVTRARWILGGFTIKSGCYYHQVIEKDGCLTLQDRSASSIVASFMPCFFLWPLLVGIILVCKRPKQ